MRELETQSTAYKLRLRLAVSIGLKVDDANATRVDAEWPARAGPCGWPPHGVAGPMRQYGSVSPAKRGIERSVPLRSITRAP